MMKPNLSELLAGENKGSRQRRSRAGALLSALLLPLLLGVMGCFELPAPIGDPEKSRIEPAMNGVWLAEEGEFEGLLMIFEPYDKRTWLVRWIQLEESRGRRETGESDETAADIPAEAPVEAAEGDAVAEPDPGEAALPEEIVVLSDERSLLELIADGDMYADGVVLFKTWRKRISGKWFITMEFRGGLDSEGGMKPEVWWGARAWLTGDDKLAIHFINNEFDELEDEMTRRELERVVRRHHDNVELYFDEAPILLERVPREYYDDIAEIVEETGVATKYE